MPTFHYPCHDPHRVDAVLACMIDRFAESAGALAHVFEYAVDRRSLLDLFPLAGSDSTLADWLVLVVRENEDIKKDDWAEASRVRGHAVAVRLAQTACALAVDPHGRQAAEALWRAAGALSGLSGPPPAAPRAAHTVADVGKIKAVLSDVFSRAGVPVEFRERNDGKVRLVAGKPTAEQFDAIDRAFMIGLDLTREQAAATEGRRQWSAIAADGTPTHVRWSTVSEEDEVRT